MKSTNFYRMHAGLAFWIMLGLVCIFCCVGCGAKPEGILIAAPGGEQTESAEIETTEAAENPEGDTGTGELYVYVCGQVQVPGVYHLPQGARICDAIEAAGGFLETAATEYWNLAQVLTENQMIAVPTKEEAAEAGGSVRPQVEAGISATLRPNPEMDISSGGQENSCGKININKASKEELMTLPGIGQAKADSIIAYRKASGGFSEIREIMNVPGIKEGLFQKVERYITAE